MVKKKHKGVDTKMEKWIEIEPKMWKPENEGDIIKGILTKKEQEVGENKNNLYHLETEDGSTSVWGSKGLDDLMLYVKVGDIVRITYKETKELKGGRTFKVFKVEVCQINEPPEEKI